MYYSEKWLVRLCLRRFVMPLIIFVRFVLFVFLACILSKEYSYLANGYADDSIVAIWSLFVGACVFIVAWVIDAFRSQPIGTGPLFWGVATWSCLPIILNGVSLLMTWVGLDTIGHYIFAFRYYCTIFSLPVLIGLYRFIHKAGVAETSSRSVPYEG